MRKPRWIAVTSIVLLALQAAAAQERDDRGPITWLAYSHVKPGMTGAAVAHALEDQPLMDELIAAGTVLSWGMATPINHDPGDTWNFLQWVTVGSWADIDLWSGAVMGKLNALSAQERKALEQRFHEIHVDGSHFDEVVRQSVISPAAAAPKYFYVADFVAKAGQGEALVEFFRQAVVPLLDPLVAEGTLTAYGVATPELHIRADWTHRFWYALPSLGAIGKMTKRFEQARTPAFDAWAGSLFAPEGHSDKVLMVLHYAR